MKKKFENSCNYKLLSYICTHENKGSSLKYFNNNADVV